MGLVPLDFARVMRTMIVLALVSAAILSYIAVHEFEYENRHPEAYGPANVIAWGAVAGALLAVTVAMLAYALRRDRVERRAHPEDSGKSGADS